MLRRAYFTHEVYRPISQLIISDFWLRKSYWSCSKFLTQLFVHNFGVSVSNIGSVTFSFVQRTQREKMEDRNMANEILTTITSVLSLFGTVFIVISFFMWKDIRTTSRRILVYISIADFFTCVATIAAVTNFWLSGSENPQVCLVQSVIGTLSVLCSFFWTVSMAVYLYISVCMKKSRLAERLMYVFHVCSWGIPLLIVTLAASLHKLGDNGSKVSAGWCWVNINLNWSDQVFWMLLAGKLWEIIASVVIAVLYALLKQNMKKEVTTMWKL